MRTFTLFITNGSAHKVMSGQRSYGACREERDCGWRVVEAQCHSNPPHYAEMSWWHSFIKTQPPAILGCWHCIASHIAQAVLCELCVGVE